MNQIILKIKDGNENAWKLLIETWTPRAYNFLRKLGASQSDAEEIVQEAWFKVLRRIKNLDSDRPFGPYFFTVLRNTFHEKTPGISSFQLFNAIALNEPDHHDL